MVVKIVHIINKKIICTICFPIYSSFPEKEIEEFLNNLNIKFLKKDRKILKNNYEIDFFIESKNLAIEFNGVYWHSTNWKNENYHFKKFIECEKIGISLFQIWEDQWMYKQEIVKSMILNKLSLNNNRIYARKCIIKEVKDFNIVKSFLNDNHLQGWCVSKVNIGLYYNDELLSLMTFGKRRLSLGKKISGINEYELLRFCNKLNTSIIGGASKLFKYFINNYNPDKIISYSNNDYSSGKIYETLGFEFDKITKPGYFYIKNFKRIHRFCMRKSQLIKEGYDPNMTEKEITDQLNYLKIYNSANKLFTYSSGLKSVNIIKTGTVDVRNKNQV